MQQPSIGRIVHYVSYGTPGGEYPSVCRAAIVTAVDDYQAPAVNGEGDHIGHVSLCVLNPEGMFFNKSVLHHEGDVGHLNGVPVEALSYRGGTWHWPERV